MRFLRVLLLLLIPATVAVAVVSVPSCINAFLEHPADWKEENARLRREAEASVKRLKERHGDKPVEQWPELDRQTYQNARRILAEMDGK